MNISSQCGFCKQLLTDSGERVDLKIANRILDWLGDFPDKYPGVRNVRTKPFWCHICFGLSASIVQTLFDLGDRLLGRLQDSCDESSTDELDDQSGLSSCMQSPKPRIIQPVYHRSQFMEVDESSSEKEQVFPALSNSVSPAQAFQAGAGQLASPLFPNLTSVVHGGGSFANYSLDQGSTNNILGSADSQPGSFQMHPFLSLPAKRKNLHNGNSFVDGPPPAKKVPVAPDPGPSAAPVSPAPASSPVIVPSSSSSSLHTSPPSNISKSTSVTTTQASSGVVSKSPSVMPQKPQQKATMKRVLNPTNNMSRRDFVAALGKQPIRPKRYTPKKNRPQFVCVVCGQSLCSKNWLDNHLRKHGISDPSKYHNHTPSSQPATHTANTASAIQVMPAITAEGTAGIAISPANSSYQIAGAISSEGTPGIVVAPASAMLRSTPQIRPKIQMPPVVPAQNLLNQNDITTASNALKLANAVSTMSSSAPVLQFNTTGEPATSLTEDQAAKLTTIAATAANMLQCTRKGKKKGIQYQCPVCYRVLRSVAWLDNHMKKHFETNAMECPICQRTFTDRKNFKRHYRLHQDDSPYKCLLCEKKCGRNKDLKYHMLKHVHEMNSGQCPICGEKYENNVGLQAHIEQSHVRFVKLLNKARQDEDALIEAVEITGDDDDDDSQDGYSGNGDNYDVKPIKIQPITDEEVEGEEEDATKNVCNGSYSVDSDLSNDRAAETDNKTSDLVKEHVDENNLLGQNGAKVSISESPAVFPTTTVSTSSETPENLSRQNDHGNQKRDLSQHSSNDADKQHEFKSGASKPTILTC